jgi:hypothetical protein
MRDKGTRQQLRLSVSTPSNNVLPIEGSSRTADCRRPAVLAGMEINADQAAIVIRIFTMYCAGVGHALIATRFNTEGIDAKRFMVSAHDTRDSQ